ncbi:MAG: hypothetical protein J7K40_09985 [candidate division Zixibacteria bacterium]|nr:hypothetical protein [candidate division Zixibacteria bacterium]
MTELSAILSQFGTTALWGIVVYKLLNFIGLFGFLTLLGYGVKKAWPELKKVIKDYVDY